MAKYKNQTQIQSRSESSIQDYRIYSHNQETKDRVNNELFSKVMLSITKSIPKGKYIKVISKTYASIKQPKNIGSVSTKVTLEVKYELIEQVPDIKEDLASKDDD